MKSINLGDIGKTRRHIILEPLEEPAVAPVTEPAAPVAVPQAEPVPA